jgi:hypothetical protein
MEKERRPDGTTRGGQEPPDNVQDRPEQNATYDAVVRGGEAPSTLDEDYVAAPDNIDSEPAADDPDERAARDAARDVRRRERSASGG